MGGRKDGDTEKETGEVVVFKGMAFNNSAGGVWCGSDAAGGCTETKKITERMKKLSSCQRCWDEIK